MPKKKKERDPEHIRRYDQFKNMEKWVKEGKDGSMFAHFEKVVKKTAVRRKHHPGYDTVGIVRKIYQGTDEKIVIMEDGVAWKIEVVDSPIDNPKYSGPLEGNILLEQRLPAKPIEEKHPEGNIGRRVERVHKQTKTKNKPQRYVFKKR